MQARDRRRRRSASSRRSRPRPSRPSRPPRAASPPLPRLGLLHLLRELRTARRRLPQRLRRLRLQLRFSRENAPDDSDRSRFGVADGADDDDDGSDDGSSSSSKFVVAIFRSLPWASRRSLSEVPQRGGTTMPPLCAFCRKTNARMLRCTRCKALFYCDKECQRADWKLHKQFCSGDPAMRPFIAVEHEVERALAAQRGHQVEPPPDVRCFICLEGGDGLMSQGCGCRGTSGFVHPECLEQMAASVGTPEDIFRRCLHCSTCGQSFTGVLRIVLMRKYWRSNRLSPQEDARRLAATVLSNELCGTLESPDFEAQEYLHDAATHGLGETHPGRIMSIVERANVLLKLRRPSDALQLLQVTVPKVKLHCTESLLYVALDLMAGSLLVLGRLEDALPIAADAVELAERLRSENSDFRHRANDLYAHCLASLGRRQEASAIWMKEVEFCERVCGPTHVKTQAIKWNLEYLLE
mmetsp:Transcript_32176/g.102586  ORF Transcript_32176/g.102586 Transcript_32176/m.102586 type:complete len:468 (-) Transcript_32176:178-1581(-)